MANIILPAVPVLNEIDDSTKLLIEQAGEINRYPISDLDIGGGDVTIDLSNDDETTDSGNPINADTLGGKPASDYVLKDILDNSFIKLNYSIIGGTTEPTNPIENMIWINTDVEITKVVFRSVEPNNPVEGMVYIYTGAGSNVSFDRIIVNGISVDEVYPISAKQYVSSAWVDVEAMSYQDGEWVDWIKYFIKEGIDNSSQWTLHTGGTGGSMSFSNGVMNLAMNATDSSSGAVVFPQVTKLQDLTNYTTLKAKIKCATTQGLISLGVYAETPPSEANCKVKKDLQFTQAETELTVDISNVSDGYLAILFDADLNSAQQTAQVIEFSVR